MPLKLKNNAVGIDISIERFQKELYTQLMKVWPEGTIWNCYGRCDRVRENGGYIAEFFDPAVGENIDPYWDDNVHIVSFFGVSGSKVEDNIREHVKMHLIVFCNLKALKPDVAHRADEEVRLEFMNIIGKCLYGFHYDGFELGISNILRDYAESLKIVSLNTVDTGNVHSFRINLSLYYNPKQSSTLKLHV